MLASSTRARTRVHTHTHTHTHRERERDSNIHTTFKFMQSILVVSEATHILFAEKCTDGN